MGKMNVIRVITLEEDEKAIDTMLKLIEREKESFELGFRKGAHGIARKHRFLRCRFEGNGGKNTRAKYDSHSDGFLQTLQCQYIDKMLLSLTPK